MTSVQKTIQLIKDAMAAVQRNDIDAALTYLQPVTPNNPLYPQATHLRGIVLHRQGKSSEAVSLMCAAADGGDQSPQLAANIAVAAMAAGTINRELLCYLANLLTTRMPDIVVLAATGPLLTALKFSAQENFERDAMVFRELAIPLLEWSLQRGHFDYALHIETQAYQAHVKQRETEEHYHDCFALLAPPMVAAGKKLHSGLPPLPLSRRTKYKIGFFIHNASTLAHIEALTNMLAGYRQLPNQPFEPVVYCFGGQCPEMNAAFSHIHVPVVMLAIEYPDTENSHFKRLLRLRERLAADSVCCLVWVSLALMMPLAFSMRIAPVQIWWSMKFHGLALDDIDGYVTSGSFSRTEIKQGRLWRAGRLQVADRYDPLLRPEAERITARYRPKKIIGTLARHELIRSTPFLDAVIGILQRNPDTIFLWTGRTEATDITLRFRDAGISSQTQFIGWVNIKIYAQVLDVFLDTFPFGCGFTVLDTLAAGTPVVFMGANPSKEDPSYDRVIWPMIEGRTGTAEDTTVARSIFTSANGEMLFLHATDSENYIELASRLLKDPEWAREVGAAGQKFINAMMSNPAQSARDFSDHFMAIIEEKLRTATS